MNALSELNARVDEITVILGMNLDSKPGDLDCQLSDLKLKLSKVYEENTEFQTLNRILKDLKLWKDKFEYSDPMIKDNSLTTEEKRLIVSMKYPVIIEAYKNLNELSRMDIPKLINYMSTSQDKLQNHEDNAAKIAFRREEILALSEKIYTLVLKNILLFERYLALMIKENNFWLQVESKVLDLNKKLNKHIKEKELNYEL